MRALIIVLTLFFTSVAHAQSACRQFEQELERAKTLRYASGDAAAAEVASLNSLQNACNAELRQADRRCEWVSKQTLQVMENDKTISGAAACARALEAERKRQAKVDVQSAKWITQP